jgi:hypothetical protein
MLIDLIFLPLTYRSKLLSLGSKNKSKLILYFSRLFVTLSLSHADCALYGRGWAGDKTYIKAFTTLWFWRLETSQTSNRSQKQSNVNVLRGYVIYTCLTLPYSHWCILLSPVCKVWRCDGHIYTYRRGASALLVSTTMGNAKASNREASDSAGLHAWTEIKFITRRYSTIQQREFYELIP